MLPALETRLASPMIIENDTELIGLADGTLVIFDLDLPLDERATAAWLDHLTNAATHGAAALDWE